ncbi:uncharacterized protein EV154DRAFT_458784 [Mucor mucedo]|uniref:uncharacterized protein n=1 Tax=Mucor mucedo TaxID=29922 RepID=UPI00221E3FDF|nr:uncharacterized protein EV154DRAFT_458784 [Mucor mucedo]KAI7894890.1 hypothetical protein EV154DRAFT_458784 [Mucor mucedo]
MYINGLKYACSTCIKGHRSSHCSHVDRPLFEIRKKGRPVTQCTFCRDLRKTKQVHIKCACSSDKKANASSTSEKPILIYRNSEENCQDAKKHGQHCTCPSPTTTTTTTAAAAAASTVTSSSTTSATATSASYLPNVTQDSPTQMKVTQESKSGLLAPLCPTPPLPVKEENLSYSWALITSPSSNQGDLPVDSVPSSNSYTDMMMDDDNSNLQHLGFIFHKPTTSTSQRFLDGQPRTRRRRSTTQKRTAAANSTTVTPTNYNRLPVNALVDSVLTIDTIHDYSLSTPPSSAVSPHHLSSLSTHEPMDVQFDYLTEQLEILSNSSHHSYIGDLSNADELTAILNNVLQKDDDDDDGVSLPSVSSYSSNNTTLKSTSTNRKSTPILPATSHPPAAAASMPPSHCGSFVPLSKCCKPVGAAGGESVVITITPLTNTTAPSNDSMMMMLEDDHQTQQKTTTRIVTCYCGNQCTCPGCLVHPSNFFLGTDPYSGLMMNNPSSSASSSCYGSDEEELSSLYGKSNNNFMSF